MFQELGLGMKPLLDSRVSRPGVISAGPNDARGVSLKGVTEPGRMCQFLVPSQSLLVQRGQLPVRACQKFPSRMSLLPVSAVEGSPPPAPPLSPLGHAAALALSLGFARKSSDFSSLLESECKS